MTIKNFSSLSMYKPISIPLVQMPSVDVSVEQDEDSAMPIWCIQTYDRKILKMKKHKRQKRKKEMLTKLKWSGKL